MIQLTKEQINIIKENTSNNLHTENLVFLANIIGSKESRILKLANIIKEIFYIEGYIPRGIMEYREILFNEISTQIEGINKYL